MRVKVRCDYLTPKHMKSFIENNMNTRADPVLAAKWINGEFTPRFNREGKTVAESPISPDRFAQFLNRISDNTLSTTLTKQVFDIMWNSSLSVDEIIEQHGLTQLSNEHVIKDLVNEAIAANPTAVEEFRSGKEKALNALTGQVMKASKGKANPAQVQKLLREKLASSS